MAKITEENIKDYILNSRSFIGSSTKGIKENNDYLIYSYNTLIFRRSDSYFDNTKYSATTSKLQNILIDCFKLNNSIKKRS